VGTEGKLGGQAEVKGVSGTWRDLTESVNGMASNLTGQVRNISQVAQAVARGDLTQKITVEAKGEVAELADTMNEMTDTLAIFAEQVTSVAREVGTDGKLGGQAEVPNVSGSWKDLTESVHGMASNLTSQVRNIAQVTTAVANGDLSQKITVEARGEILELKNTINLMVDQLSAFASEVTRVAREVGTEGRLGGQAEVEGVSGTWRRLTENVNMLAANLTSQVRAIAETSAAVIQGDFTREVAVEAQGEIAELKDTINQMIANLAATTTATQEQDWLKTNLARITSLMQGQRDLAAVARMIMSEVTPVVSAQHGGFFLAEGMDEEKPGLRLIASYAYKQRKNLSSRFGIGEGVVGQAALEKKRILITQAPSDYIKIASGLGEAVPLNIIVIPVVFEDNVLAVIELASFKPFGAVSQDFLEQLTETLGIVLNTISQTMRTEELLGQSQSLAAELQSQSEELQTQQEELQQRNEELEEKAGLLAEQNRDIELKNREIETQSRELERRAEELSVSSRYKSEFLANMSHELRTPLNSLLILSKLLQENPEKNLSEKQVEFASTIHNSGSDLLALIDEILDLSKIEAGKMDVAPRRIVLTDVRDFVTRTFGPLAEQKSLGLETKVERGLPKTIVTDEQRLQQVLKNLVSNALKFTTKGNVVLNIRTPATGTTFSKEELKRAGRVLAFEVSDTGPGIPREKLALIFEAFQQADGTTSRRYGGTGLGLSISREIARLLGGEIRVESTPGVGSVFTLYLPATYPRPAENGGTPKKKGGPGQPETGEGSPETVMTTSGPPIVVPAPETDDPALLLEAEIADDRGEIGPGDRVFLAIEDDPGFARAVLEVGRTNGFKGLVALRADTGLALAHEHRPDAILLDLKLAGSVDGFAVLDHLKSHADTRHIPVSVVSGLERRREALKAGAAAFYEKPLGQEQLGEVFHATATFLDKKVKHLLVVEDNEAERLAIQELIGTEGNVAITSVGSSEEAFAAMSETRFECMVLDLKLPEMSGFELLETIKKDKNFSDLPVIVYTGAELTRQEETKLRKHAEAIIVKDVRSPERLLDETSLYLHRPQSKLPKPKQEMLEELHRGDVAFEGKKILIVDDDVRNVFALSSVLESRGMEVLFAENGKEGLDVLKRNENIDLVLMDIMMPEMDGYETMQRLRKIRKFERLPVISLTAKAMTGDREKSINAGASDYITKPVDTDQLLSLMRVWLYR
ncbi:MAG: response regulator, partial [Actinomycetota bacterium]